jgi:hypothetical protein
MHYSFQNLNLYQKHFCMHVLCNVGDTESGKGLSAVLVLYCIVSLFETTRIFEHA